MQDRFELRTAPNGVTYLACSALETPHGFSTRLGGESSGPYASLNLGVSSGDDEPTVYRNRQRWMAALGLEGPVSTMHQVHGATVHAVSARPQETLYGDGILSATPGLPICVFTADCTPVLLHDPVTGAVGAVHAGWRGTVAQIARVAVESMQAHYGARPEHIRAAIGPAIGPCCFEVGHEVVAEVEKSAWPGWQTSVVAKQPRPHLDLFEANRAQLAAAGLAPENIHVSGLCTACREDLFYSWRRDQARTGRLQATIAAGARA